MNKTNEEDLCQVEANLTQIEADLILKFLTDLDKLVLRTADLLDNDGDFIVKLIGNAAYAITCRLYICFSQEEDPEPMAPDEFVDGFTTQLRNAIQEVDEARQSKKDK